MKNSGLIYDFVNIVSEVSVKYDNDSKVWSLIWRVLKKIKKDSKRRFYKEWKWIRT